MLFEEGAVAPQPPRNGGKMKTLLLRILIVVAALLPFSAAKAHADAIIVGTAISDHAGNFIMDMQIDPNADPVFVADQLKANLELSSGSVKSVTISDGLAHVSGEGATPTSEVQAMLNNDVALATGVGPSPAGIEHRRRAFWLLGGLAGLAAGGGTSGNPETPLEEEPTPTPTIPGVPPPPPPTPTSPPILSPGP
jgi:hypothetical protein